MLVESTTICLTGKDLVSLIKRNLSQNTPINNIAVQITDDSIIVSGKYKASIMKKELDIPFQATFHLNTSGRVIGFELVHLRAARFPLDKLRSILLTLLTRRIPQICGIQRTKNGLRCDVDEALGNCGVRAQIEKLVLLPNPDQLLIEFSGSLELA